MKYLVLVIFIGSFFYNRCYAQFDTLHLPLNKEFIKEKEFSGLCLYGGDLFLLPQYSKISKSQPLYLYGLSADQAYEMAYAGSKREINYQRKIEILGLKKVKNSNDDLNENYDGLEAICIVGDTCYILIETKIKSPNGYLVMGLLNHKDGREVLSLKKNFIKPLAKPVKIKNMGFEAMYFDPESRMIKVFFEYNGSCNQQKGFIVSPDLKVVEPLKFPDLPFRISDICIDQNNEVFGINYYWGGEYEELIRSEPDSIAAIAILSIALCKDTGFTYSRIVKLEAAGWSSKGTVPSNKLNWEGMAPYREGFFLVSDDNGTAGLLTRLIFIRP